MWENFAAAAYTNLKMGKWFEYIDQRITGIILWMSSNCETHQIIRVAVLSPKLHDSALLDASFDINYMTMIV